jgi:hypothetical protein
MSLKFEQDYRTINIIDLCTNMLLSLYVFYQFLPLWVFCKALL